MQEFAHLRPAVGPSVATTMPTTGQRDLSAINPHGIIRSSSLGLSRVRAESGPVHVGGDGGGRSGLLDLGYRYRLELVYVVTPGHRICARVDGSAATHSLGGAASEMAVTRSFI